MNRPFFYRPESGLVVPIITTIAIGLLAIIGRLFYDSDIKAIGFIIVPVITTFILSHSEYSTWTQGTFSSNSCFILATTLGTYAHLTNQWFGSALWWLTVIFVLVGILKTIQMQNYLDYKDKTIHRFWIRYWYLLNTIQMAAVYKLTASLINGGDIQLAWKIYVLSILILSAIGAVSAKRLNSKIKNART